MIMPRLLRQQPQPIESKPAQLFFQKFDCLLPRILIVRARPHLDVTSQATEGLEFLLHATVLFHFDSHFLQEALRAVVYWGSMHGRRKVRREASRALEFLPADRADEGICGPGGYGTASGTAKWRSDSCKTIAVAARRSQDGPGGCRHVATVDATASRCR